MADIFCFKTGRKLKGFIGKSKNKKKSEVRDMQWDTVVLPIKQIEEEHGFVILGLQIDFESGHIDFRVCDKK